MNCSECGVSGNGKKNRPCSRCKAVYYCSRSCQARHWSAGHKKECVPAIPQATPASDRQPRIDSPALVHTHLKLDVNIKAEEIEAALNRSKIGEEGGDRGALSGVGKLGMPNGTDTALEPASKQCGACSLMCTRDAFSKKQWDARTRRRCRACIGAGARFDNALLPPTLLPPAPSAKSAKNETRRAGNERRRSGDSGVKGIQVTLGYDQCGWCGKTDGQAKLMYCPACRNTAYCGAQCQKLAWSEHKKTCAELKEARLRDKAMGGNSGKLKKKSEQDFVMCDANACGTITLSIQGPIGTLTWGDFNDDRKSTFRCGAKAKASLINAMGQEKFQQFFSRYPGCHETDGYYHEAEIFHEIEDLLCFPQFMLSCGPLNDLDRAKALLPQLLAEIKEGGASIDRIRMPGVVFTPLDWAARKGNTEVVQWLCTDSRTRSLVNTGTPVAWACYTNRVAIAKMLVEHGADSRRTEPSVYNHKPALHLAVENGQLLALRWLVEEQGHDPGVLDAGGRGPRAAIREIPEWQDLAGHKACDEYLGEQGVGRL